MNTFNKLKKQKMKWFDLPLGKYTIFYKDYGYYNWGWRVYWGDFGGYISKNIHKEYGDALEELSRHYNNKHYSILNSA